MNSTTLSNTADTSEQSANRDAIVGASGYGGLQTIRLLKDHPFFGIDSGFKGCLRVEAHPGFPFPGKASNPVDIRKALPVAPDDLNAADG